MRGSMKADWAKPASSAAAPRNRIAAGFGQRQQRLEQVHDRVLQQRRGDAGRGRKAAALEREGAFDAAQRVLGVAAKGVVAGERVAAREGIEHECVGVQVGAGVGDGALAGCRKGPGAGLAGVRARIGRDQRLGGAQGDVAGAGHHAGALGIAVDRDLARLHHGPVRQRGQRHRVETEPFGEDGAILVEPARGPKRQRRGGKPVQQFAQGVHRARPGSGASGGGAGSPTPDNQGRDRGQDHGQALHRAAIAVAV